MRFTVRIRPRAEEDIRLAREWYDNIRPELGRQFAEASPCARSARVAAGALITAAWPAQRECTMRPRLVAEHQERTSSAQNRVILSRADGEGSPAAWGFLAVCAASHEVSF